MKTENICARCGCVTRNEIVCKECLDYLHKLDINRRHQSYFPEISAEIVRFKNLSLWLKILTIIGWFSITIWFSWFFALFVQALTG